MDHQSLRLVDGIESSSARRKSSHISVQEYRGPKGFSLETRPSHRIVVTVVVFVLEQRALIGRLMIRAAIVKHTKLPYASVKLIRTKLNKPILVCTCAIVRRAQTRFSLANAIKLTRARAHLVAHSRRRLPRRIAIASLIFRTTATGSCWRRIRLSTKQQITASRTPMHGQQSVWPHTYMHTYMQYGWCGRHEIRATQRVPKCPRLL